MAFFDHLPKSLPALTALATVVAAIIAAVVASIVASVNAWSVRRAARDTAHRAFREELAGAAVAATKQLLSEIHELLEISRKGTSDDWRNAMARTYQKGVRLRTDLRTPHEPVLADA